MNYGRFHFANSYVTGDRLRQCCDLRVEAEYSPALKSVPRGARRIFCKTDYVDRLFAAMSDYKGECVLVTHDSDFPITERLWVKKPEQIKLWYAINTEIKESALIPIPLGCENKRTPGYSGNMMVLDRVISRNELKKYLVLINFNARTCVAEREPILDLFKDVGWTHFVGYGLPFEDCLNTIKASRFVFCPRGNGQCTHRMWESLYLGSIPIVKRSVHMEGFEGSLPILVVDRWRDVTHELLDRTWEDYSHREWNMDKASFPYWRKRIKEGDGIFVKGHR